MVSMQMLRGSDLFGELSDEKEEVSDGSRGS